MFSPQRAQRLTESFSFYEAKHFIYEAKHSVIQSVAKNLLSLYWDEY